VTRFGAKPLEACWNAWDRRWLVHLSGPVDAPVARPTTGGGQTRTTLARTCRVREGPG
jgi:hypothetical protein